MRSPSRVVASCILLVAHHRGLTTSASASSSSSSDVAAATSDRALSRNRRRRRDGRTSGGRSGETIATTIKITKADVDEDGGGNAITTRRRLRGRGGGGGGGRRRGVGGTAYALGIDNVPTPHRRHRRRHRRKRRIQDESNVVSDSYLADHPWYPNHDLLTCVADGNMPSFMTYEGGYAESHLFESSEECCQRWFPDLLDGCVVRDDDHDDDDDGGGGGGDGEGDDGEGDDGEYGGDVDVADWDDNGEDDDDDVDVTSDANATGDDYVEEQPSGGIDHDDMDGPTVPEVEGMEEKMEEDHEFPTSSCGYTLEEAQSCTALCVSGYGCPDGQSCFVDVMCPSSQVAHAMGDGANAYVLETIDPSDEIRENTSPISVCGVDYTDAERRCRSGGDDGDGGDDGMGTFGFAIDFVACPSGMDGDCPDGEVCYGGVLCPIIPPPTTTTTATATTTMMTDGDVEDEPMTTTDGESEPMVVEGSIVRGDKTEVVGSSVVPSTPRPSPVDDVPATSPAIPSSSSNASPYTIDVSTLSSSKSSVAADTCAGGCPDGSTCVGSTTGGILVVDADCVACETGQTWWPCDVDGACWCWTDGTERIAAAPESGLVSEMAVENPNYTACDDILTRDTFAKIAPDATEPYTYEGLCDAMLSYNARHDEKVFGMGNAYQRAAELAAFLGNTLHESDELRAGREYLMCGDNVVVDGEVYCKPCDSGSFDWDLKVCNQGLVSGTSEFNEYCQPTSEPPEACQCGNGVGESGELEGYVAAKHLFFGRGSIQLSWNYNYIGASIALTGSPDTFCDNPDLIATEGRYAWGAGIYFWMEHSKEGTTCHMEALTDAGDFGGTLNNINGGLECPAHGGWHVDAVKARLNRYCRAAKALGLPNRMSLNKCSGLQDSLDTCLSEGTCEDCQHFVGSTPGSIDPDFVPPAPVPATATTTTASDDPAEIAPSLCPEGMMPWEENPDCCVPNTNFIGDGACDPEAPYNIEACGYDGGDCCKETCSEDTAFGCTLKEGDELHEYGPFGFFCIDPSQGDATIRSALCEIDEKYRIADGRCDPMFNTQECNYDGGDCCEDSCDDVFAFYPCGSGAGYVCLDPHYKADLPKPADDREPTPVDDLFSKPDSPTTTAEATSTTTSTTITTTTTTPATTKSPTTTTTKPIACKTTLRECPGGEFVGQDHANNCRFFACPKVTNDQPSQSSLASSFASSFSSTKQSKTQASSLVSSDIKGENSTQTMDKYTIPEPPTLIATQIPTFQHCEKDLLECSDGTFVKRSPDNHCKFLDCPVVAEEEAAESIAASISSNSVKVEPRESIASSISSTTAKEEPAKSFPASSSSTAAKVSRFPVVGHHGHCTDELKRCSDGSFVARDPNSKCEFSKCPTNEQGSIEALSGQFSTTSESTDHASTNIVDAEDSVHEKDKQMNDCSQALFQCEDGHYVRQDPNNGCNWYPCEPPRSSEPSAAPCETDLFTCADGSYVERDIDNGCKFFECRKDESAKVASVTFASTGQAYSLHEKDNFGD